MYNYSALGNAKNKLITLYEFNFKPKMYIFMFIQTTEIK